MNISYELTVTAYNGQCLFNVHWSNTCVARIWETKHRVCLWAQCDSTTLVCECTQSGVCYTFALKLSTDITLSQDTF